MEAKPRPGPGLGHLPDDILEQPGSVILSYSRNSTDLGAVLRNPLLYRPKFIRVDLPGR